MRERLEKARVILARRRKALAALIGIPVAAVFVHFGVDEAIGVTLSDELEIGIVAALVSLLVEQTTNKKPAGG